MLDKARGLRLEKAIDDYVKLTEGTKSLILSIPQFREVIQYAYNRRNDHMISMDHEFSLTKDYYGGHNDIIYSCGPGGILLTTVTQPLIDFYFNWDLIKDMERPDGVCGHKINQFMVDQFKKRDMYNYVDMLDTLKGHSLVMEFDN